MSQLQRGSDLVRHTLALGADTSEHNHNFQDESGAEQGRNACAAELLEQLGPPARESVAIRGRTTPGDATAISFPESELVWGLLVQATSLHMVTSLDTWHLHRDRLASLDDLFWDTIPNC